MKIATSDRSKWFVFVSFLSASCIILILYSEKTRNTAVATMFSSNDDVDDPSSKQENGDHKNSTSSELDQFRQIQFSKQRKRGKSRAEMPSLASSSSPGAGSQMRSMVDSGKKRHKATDTDHSEKQAVDVEKKRKDKKVDLYGTDVGGDKSKDSDSNDDENNHKETESTVDNDNQEGTESTEDNDNQVEKAISDDRVNQTEVISLKEKYESKFTWKDSLTYEKEAHSATTRNFYSTVMNRDPIHIMTIIASIEEFNMFLVTIKSILLHRNPCQKLRFHLITKPRIASFSRQFEFGSNLAHDSVSFNLITDPVIPTDSPTESILTQKMKAVGFPKESHFRGPKRELSKLLALAVLPEFVDQALYIDFKILVTRSLDFLWDSFDRSKLFAFSCTKAPELVQKKCGQQKGNLCTQDESTWCESSIFYVNVKQLRAKLLYTNWIINNTFIPFMDAYQQSKPLDFHRESFINVLIVKLPESDQTRIGCHWSCPLSSFLAADLGTCQDNLCSAINCRDSPKSVMWKAYDLLPVERVISRNMTMCSES